MNTRYKAFYYLKSNGRSPVEKYFKTIKHDTELAEVKEHISFLVQEEGVLPPPYTRHVWKKIYELRFQTIGGKQRIFYFIHTQKKIILLDGYTKKSQKIPARHLKRMKKYYLDYLNNEHEKKYC